MQILDVRGSVANLNKFRYCFDFIVHMIIIFKMSKNLSSTCIFFGTKRVLFYNNTKFVKKTHLNITIHKKVFGGIIFRAKGLWEKKEDIY